MKVPLTSVPAICSNNDSLYTTEIGFSIKGQVKEESLSIPCRVRLHDKASGRIVADVATDNAGHFQFDHLGLFRFYAVAYHPTTEYNALIFDDLIPK